MSAQRSGSVPAGSQPPLPRPVVLRQGLLRRWPTAPPAHPALLLVFAALGLVAAVTLPARAGLQYPLIGALALATVTLAQRLSRSPQHPGRALSRAQVRWRRTFAALSLLLLAVTAIRDGGSALVVLAALGVACYAVVTDTRLAGALLAPVLVGFASLRGIRWLSRATTSLARLGRVDAAVLRGAAVCASLVFVVGALLSGADAAFSGLLHNLVPHVELDRPGLRVFIGLVVTGFVVALSYSALAPADLGPRHLGQGRARVEWLLPIVGLGLLLGIFLLVQAALLFDRYPSALVEGNLTPAERARQGFGHLVAVTLIVISTLAWVAARVRPADRVRFALAGGIVLIEVLFLAASALRRLLLYSDAFGWSVARVQAGAFEAWLALTLVATALLWWLGRGHLVTRVSVLSAGVGVLLLTLLSPDALVARAGVARYAATGQIDPVYLSRLSADAAPALMGLPEPLRSCVLDNSGLDSEWANERWFEANRSRAQAQRLGRQHPLIAVPDCSVYLASTNG